MRQSTKTTFIAPGALVLFYRAALPLSRRTLTFVSGIIRCRRPGRHLDPHRPGGRGPSLYSGKHRKHGMNLQVIASPGGGIVWASGTLPGAVHDKEAEWIWGVLAELEAAGLVTLAIRGYQGSMYATIPYRGKNKPESRKEANRAHAKLRAPGERANAQLKPWKIRPRLCCCPWRAGQLAKAIHALETHAA